VENSYSENHVIEYRLRSTDIIRAVLNILQKVKILFSINTNEIYEMIVDLPTSLKLLFNFSKQASSVVAANFYESYSTFQTFCKFQVIRLYRRNYANL